jgi:hypothetical protein
MRLDAPGSTNSDDKPLIHQHFSTIAEPRAEVNRSKIRRPGFFS